MSDDSEPEMDSQSVKSDASTSSDPFFQRLRFRYRLKKTDQLTTDCQKQAWMIASIKRMDTVIEGYHKILLLPKVPANIGLQEITKKEVEDTLKEKEMLAGWRLNFQKLEMRDVSPLELPSSSNI
ncbi:hypothetical protein TNCT_136421 [Trichonephila clavata]|uniref:Uncharacterized protein n=1 Tax=Trichonephila clavata TaxID=2740835 RepID=A0A8X6HWA0_TRICU|nr:hypothetical protein TNCT_136421 [Trichonephila clavata]